MRSIHAQELAGFDRLAAGADGHGFEGLQKQLRRFWFLIEHDQRLAGSLRLLESSHGAFVSRQQCDVVHSWIERGLLVYLVSEGYRRLLILLKTDLDLGSRHRGDDLGLKLERRHAHGFA